MPSIAVYTRVVYTKAVLEGVKGFDWDPHNAGHVDRHGGAPAEIVSIRLSVADIELAKNIASKRGTGYQTVLKQAIRSGLKRAG